MNDLYNQFVVRVLKRVRIVDRLLWKKNPRPLRGTQLRGTINESIDMIKLSKKHLFFLKGDKRQGYFMRKALYWAANGFFILPSFLDKTRIREEMHYVILMDRL